MFGSCPLSKNCLARFTYSKTVIDFCAHAYGQQMLAALAKRSNILQQHSKTIENELSPSNNFERSQTYSNIESTIVGSPNIVAKRPNIEDPTLSQQLLAQCWIVWPGLKSALDYHHVPEMIQYLVTNLYTDFHSYIISDRFSTPAIPFKRGVLQGDCLSPLLFNLCFNTFIQFVKQEKYNQLGFSPHDGNDRLFHSVHWFQFADDAAVITTK